MDNKTYPYSSIVAILKTIITCGYRYISKHCVDKYFSKYQAEISHIVSFLHSP